MKKLSIFLILILFFSKSFSSLKWKKVSTNKNEDSFYVNESEITKNNNLYTFLVLISSPSKADSKHSGIKSIAIRIQCECSDFKYTTKEIFLHTDYMGKGERKISSRYDVMNFNSPNFWTFASKDSSEESVLKFVCSK